MQLVCQFHLPVGRIRSAAQCAGWIAKKYGAARFALAAPYPSYLARTIFEYWISSNGSRQQRECADI